MESFESLRTLCLSSESGKWYFSQENTQCIHGSPTAVSSSRCVLNVCVVTCVLFPQGVVMATWPYSKGVGRELGGSGGSRQWHRNSGGRGGQIDVK